MSRAESVPPPAPRPPGLIRGGPWSGVGLGLVLAILTAIAALAVMADLAGLGAVRGLGPTPAGEVRLLVWGHGLESADAAQARAAAILAGQPGVSAARPLDPGPSDALAARLTGAPRNGEVRMLAVEAGDRAGAVAAKAPGLLALQDLPARVAGGGAAGVSTRAMIVIAIGVALPLISLVVSLLHGAGGARREAARAGPVIEAARLSGAGDGHITRLILGRVAWAAAWGALWGAAAAMAGLALLARFGGGLLPVAPSRADLVSPWPAVLLAVWLACVAGAWIGARAAARRSP